MIAIYLRTSTDKQETAGQKQAINQWIIEKGYATEKLIWFEDSGKSGKTLDRVSFKNLMGAVKAGQIEKVITFELSRLSRDFLDALNTLKVLTDYGVVVEIPGDGELPFNNVMDQFMAAAKSLVSAQERLNIGRRTKEKLAELKSRGIKLGRPKSMIDEPNKRGWRKEYDQVLVEKILMAKKSGLSTSKIAKLLSNENFTVSQPTVHRIYRKHYGDVALD